MTLEEFTASVPMLSSVTEGRSMSRALMLLMGWQSGGTSEWVKPERIQALAAAAGENQFFVDAVASALVLGERKFRITFLVTEDGMKRMYEYEQARRKVN